MIRRTSAFVLSVALIAIGLLLPVARAQMFPINMSDGDAKADPNIKLPAYDVASIKENKSGNGMMSIMMKPDGYTCINISLKTLVSNAYGIRQDLISGGPGWASSEGFDVDAKVAPEDVEAFKKLTPRQRNSLLQALLEERFHLKTHIETKVLPMYDLVIAKGGPKLKPYVEDTSIPEEKSDDATKLPSGGKPRGRMTMGPGMFKGEALPMKSIVNQLASTLNHTVVDKTGLTGDFDLELKWSPENAPASGDASADATVSIFTALQEQLGLKLLPTKGPVDTLVIDHVDMPTGN